MGVRVTGCSCSRVPGRTHSHSSEELAQFAEEDARKIETEAERLRLLRKTSWDRIQEDYLSDRKPRLWKRLAPLPGVLKIKVAARWQRFLERWSRPTPPTVSVGAMRLLTRFTDSNGVVMLNESDREPAHELVQAGLAQWGTSPTRALYISNAGRKLLESESR